MLALTYLVLFASCSMAMVIPRNASTILSDLENINAGYQDLKNADDNFATSGPQPVQNAVDEIELANVIAISDSGLSGPLSESDVQSIVDYVNDTLEPSIEAAIQAAESVKSSTDQAAISGAVAIEMQELKSFSDLIGQNLEALAPSKTAASNIEAAFAKIDSDYEAGIAFLQS